MLCHLLSPERISSLSPFELSIQPYTLHYHRPAATSRGKLHQLHTYYIHCHSPLGDGIGESCPLLGLSPELADAQPPYLQQLSDACAAVQAAQGLSDELITALPSSILFGIECALLSALRADSEGQIIIPSPYTEGTQDIPIHQLIWMDSLENMLQQIDDGASAGHRALKWKLGSLPWADELTVLQYASRHYPSLELRADANGSMSPSEAADKLPQLADAGLHWIEQPIKAGQHTAMAALCRSTEHSHLRIALDEELIAYPVSQREQLIGRILPHGLVIKPSLHGGLHGAQQWQSIAAKHGISHWYNSSLESNITLNILAQWVAAQPQSRGIVQGLGKGTLYRNNCPTRSQIIEGNLHYTG